MGPWMVQDEFASLPAIVPKGPIAIFGLVSLCITWTSSLEIYFSLNQTHNFMHAVTFFWMFQGGGTAAHLMLDLWPSLQLEGWEIDGIVRNIMYLSIRTLYKVIEKMTASVIITCFLLNKLTFILILFCSIGYRVVRLFTYQWGAGYYWSWNLSATVSTPLLNIATQRPVNSFINIYATYTWRSQKCLWSSTNFQMEAWKNLFWCACYNTQ